MRADLDHDQEAIQDLAKEVEAEVAVGHDHHILDLGPDQDLSVDQGDHQADPDQEIVAQGQRVNRDQEVNLDQEVDQYLDHQENVMPREVSVDPKVDPKADQNQEVVHDQDQQVQGIEYNLYTAEHFILL